MPTATFSKTGTTVAALAALGLSTAAGFAYWGYQNWDEFNSDYYKKGYAEEQQLGETKNDYVAGYEVPGYEVPGYEIPGYQAPAPIDDMGYYNAPGYAIPGGLVPGYYTPGYALPSEASIGEESYIKQEEPMEYKKSDEQLQTETTIAPEMPVKKNKK